MGQVFFLFLAIVEFLGLILFIFLPIFTTRHYDLNDYIWLSLSIIFVSWLIYICLILASDIEINDDGIVISIDKAKFEKVIWNDVISIKSFPYNTRYGEDRRFYIVVRDKPLWLSIKFTTRELSHLNQVVETLNFYIGKHNIKVLWVDEIMKGPLDYRELKQLPLPPYGDDES